MGNYNIVRLGIALLFHLKELQIAEEALSTPVPMEEAQRVIAQHGSRTELEARRENLQKCIDLFNVSAALKDFFETHPEKAGLDPLPLSPEKLLDAISGRVSQPLISAEFEAPGDFSKLPVLEFKPGQALPVAHDNLRVYMEAQGQTHPGVDFPPKEAAAAPRLPRAELEDKLVRDFAGRMMGKLEVARQKGRGGWDSPEECSIEHLFDCLTQHITKDNLDFVDVANIAAFLQWRLDNVPGERKRLGGYAGKFRASQAEALTIFKALPAVRNLLARINNDGGITERIVGLEDAAFIALKRLEREERQREDEAAERQRAALDAPSGLRGPDGKSGGQ